tara:strand:- start:65 stop:733 length:669 start_codon:yes stop_codon:yes gene_type:complete
MSFTVTTPTGNAPSTTVTTENQYERFRMQKDLGESLIKNIKKVLRTEDINFTQDLSNSFEFVMHISPSEPNVGTASVVTSNPYANLVDKGMKPGVTVSFDALYDWVRIKIGLEEPELTPITWKILHKIRNKGIKPTRFAKKAIKMTIGKHGIPNIKKRSSTSKKKYGKFMKKLVKFANKIKKVIKKMKRILKKIVKLRKINKGLRQLNKYGSKSIDKMRKYK